MPGEAGGALMMNVPYAYRNRRDGHRVYLRTEVTCADSRGGAREAALGNLGPRGIFIHAPAPWPAGTRLALKFRLMGSEKPEIIEAAGEVVWVRRREGGGLPGFGVRFTGIGDAHARAIRALIGKRHARSQSLGIS